MDTPTLDRVPQERNNALLAECVTCNWKRYVTLDAKRQEIQYYHAGYQKVVTVLEAAKLDAFHHDCERHARAQQKVREGYHARGIVRTNRRDRNVDDTAPSDIQYARNEV